MFWILRKSRLTSSAISFFNGINNNSTASPIGVGYNKLCCNEDNEDDVGFNLHKAIVDNNCTIRDLDSDSSSCSEVELEEDLSQDSDYDDILTCNVCERFFCNQQQLSQHQRKKRHFGCSACDSLFQSLMALEHHKEEFDHWSGDEGGAGAESGDESDHNLSHEMDRLI